MPYLPNCSRRSILRGNARRENCYTVDGRDSEFARLPWVSAQPLQWLAGCGVRLLERWEYRSRAGLRARVEKLVSLSSEQAATYCVVLKGMVSGSVLRKEEIVGQWF